MSNEELRAQASRSEPHIKVAAGLWIVGAMMIMAITITWVVMSVNWANDYYAIGKTARDAAEAGSGTLAQLRNFQTTAAWVLPLQVLGLTTFLLGFGFAFANILKNIRLRANTMAAVLPAVKQAKSRGKG